MTNDAIQFCAYCGDVANTMDHVPPISSYVRSVAYRRRNGGVRYKNKPWVWSCRECNLLLGNSLLLTIPERAAFIEAKLRVRYTKLLAAPVWLPEELADLEPSMRQTISSQLVEQAHVQYRIATASLIAIPPPPSEE